MKRVKIFEGVWKRGWCFGGDLDRIWEIFCFGEFFFVVLLIIVSFLCVFLMKEVIFFVLFKEGLDVVGEVIVEFDIFIGVFFINVNCVFKVFCKLFIVCDKVLIDLISFLFRGYSFFLFRKKCLNFVFCKIFEICVCVLVYCLVIWVNLVDLIFFFVLLRKLEVMKVILFVNVCDVLILFCFNWCFVERGYMSKLILIVNKMLSFNILKIWMIFLLF